MILPLVLLNRRRIGGFSPRAIIGGSTALVWLDPSDLTTLFQDAAGTTPVTAPGQPVGLILDKSGNGFHATASGTSRPTYGVVPSRGRVNLLTRTGFDGAVSGTPGTAPTGWPFASSGGTQTVNLAGGALGGASVQIEVTANRHYYQRFETLPNNTTQTFSVAGTCVVGVPLNQIITLIGTVTGITTEYKVNGVTQSSGFSLPVGDFALELLVTTTTGHSGNALRLGVGTSSNITGNITFRDPQLELGSTASPYQRVASQFEVTDPVGFPSYPCHYLQFDGVDDFMVTPTITPNADKVQVFAGVRKLSDAAAGMIAELSTSVGTNAGTFYLTGPENTGASGNFSFKTRGSVNPPAFASSGVQLAPVTAVLSGLGDIAADLATIRFNGIATAYSADQGTGNFLAYPLFIGRRGGTTIPFNGQIFGLIVRFSTANLDAGLISQTERWMAQKTPGVTIA